jgi:plasmid stability protein
MTAMLIRGIDDKLKRALRLRAAENGLSMEEEVRQILRKALGVLSPAEEEARKFDEMVALERAKRTKGR